MQIERRAPGAPFAVGIFVAGAGLVGERPDVGRGERLVLDRRIDLFQEWQRHVARQIDRAGRPVENKARLRDIHVELFEDRRRGAVDGLGIGRLGIAGKQREEFLLGRMLVGPFVEMKQRSFAVGRAGAGVIAERDGAGLDLRHVGFAGVGDVLDGENPALAAEQTPNNAPSNAASRAKSAMACRVHILSSLMGVL